MQRLDFVVLYVIYIYYIYIMSVINAYVAQNRSIYIIIYGMLS